MPINNIRNGPIRFSGIASGLDTGQIVSDLMRLERAPLNRLEQRKQVSEWRREEYRNITNQLRGFKEKFFDVLRPTNYMFSQEMYRQFSVTSTNDSVVTASANHRGVAGNNSVKVEQLATADIAVSGENISKGLVGSPTEFNLEGKSIRINLDGVRREISLDDYDDLDDLISKSDTGLQALVDKAFGAGKINVSNDGGQLRFDTTGGATRIMLENPSENSGLEALGFTGGATNRLNVNETLGDLANKFAVPLTFDENENLVFTINSKEFTFSKDTNLQTMMNTINRDSTANVNMSYDEVTDKIRITANQLGSGENINISQSGGNFFAQGGTVGAIGIDVENPIVEEHGGSFGVDAIARINDEVVTRSSNSFELNGVTYSLNQVSDIEQTISVQPSNEDVFEKIKYFVDSYNELIDSINSKISERPDREYRPLTQEERRSMSTDEVELWEERAKKGMLSRDSALQDIVNRFRTAVYDGIEGVDGNLTSIGITTGSYLGGGRLIINETRLKAAIDNDPEQVMNIFSRQSTSHPRYTRSLQGQERTDRYREQGIAYRLSDIIDDNISILRDPGGRKGRLLEIAGMQGDTSDTNNLLSRQIESYDSRMEDLMRKMALTESRYYAQFTALERVMGRMNNQSDWLGAQLGSL